MSRFLITTSINGRSRQQVWDSHTPLALDHPFRWVLEQTPAGIRVRSLQSKPNQVTKGGHLKLTPEIIRSGSRLKLQSGKDSTPILLQIRPIQGMEAVFVRKAPAAATARALVAFSCIGNTVLQSEEVRGGYLAYVAGKPVFRLKKSADNVYELKALGEKLDLSLSGKTLVMGTDESKLLRDSDLTELRIAKGACSWHFIEVAQPQVDPQMAVAEPEIDDQWFKRAVGMASMALLLFLFSIAILPTPKEKPEEIIPAQYAKIVFTKPRPAAASAVATAPKAQAAAPVAPSQEPVAEAPKEIAKAQPKPETPRQTKQAVAKKPVTPPKAVAQATPQPPRPSKAVLRAQALQNAMSGLMKGGMTALLKESDLIKQANNANSGAAALEGKSNVAPAVDMNMALQGLAAKIGAVGGRGVAALGGNGNGGVGYGKGERAKVGGGGKGGSFVTLDAGGATAEEGLTRDEVGEVIHKHMSEVRYCYEAAILRMPNIEGKLVLAFTINGGGAVKSSQVQSSTDKDPSLDQCVMRRLAAWKFPRPKGGVDVAITYPFIFKTLGSE